MKKIDLVHTGVLIIALMLGYSALQTLISFFSMAGYYSDVFFSSKGMQSAGIPTLLSLLLLSGACAALVKYGRTIAEKILQNEPESVDGDQVAVHLDRHNLIMVVLIGLGVFTVLNPLPHFLVDIYELFRNKVTVDEFRTRTVDADTIAVELLKLTMGFFLIYAASPITNFIEKKIPAKTESGS
jgi:hypothetical protein